MTAEQRLRAAYALWRDAEATSDQRQAALLIAQQRKFRLKTVIGLDEDRKARHLAGLSTLPAQISVPALPKPCRAASTRSMGSASVAR